MREDTIAYAKRYHQCQIFTPSIKVAPKEPASILNLWPFAKWRIDIIGPLSTAPGKVKFALVAVDYFTKWVEALATITQDNVIKFIWRNIICMFNLPQAIITNNQKQFDGLKINDFFRKWKITKLFPTLYHHQSNGQVEAINKIINHTLKTRLEGGKEK